MQTHISYQRNYSYFKAQTLFLPQPGTYQDIAGFGGIDFLNMPSQHNDGTDKRSIFCIQFR